LFCLPGEETNLEDLNSAGFIFVDGDDSEVAKMDEFNSVSFNFAD
jgi:hypothetical protein